MSNALDNLKQRAGASGRQFLAAVAKQGKVMLVWADGGEPLADVVTALAEVGVEPEALDALARKTVALAKSRTLRRGAIIAAADQLRAACGDDDTFTRIVSGELVLSNWNGYIAKGVMVTKGAKHDGRKDITTGKFHSMSRPAQSSVDGITWTHEDRRTGIGWTLDGEHGPPEDTGDPQQVRPYDGTPGDAAGQIVGNGLRTGKYGVPAE